MLDINEQDREELEYTIDSIDHQLEMESITLERLNRFGEEQYKIWMAKSNHVKKIAKRRLAYLDRCDKAEAERVKTERHKLTVALKHGQITEERNAYSEAIDAIDNLEMGIPAINDILAELYIRLDEIANEANLHLGV